MSNVPEGAQLSEDGNFWWDGKQWQLVTGEASGGDRAAARVVLGMPASLSDLTDKHRKAHLGEPTVEVEVTQADHVEVLAVQETDEGEGIA